MKNLLVSKFLKIDFTRYVEHVEELLLGSGLGVLVFHSVTITQYLSLCNLKKKSMCSSSLFLAFDENIMAFSSHNK